ncbi:MAG TPA: hypothetical protein VN782_04370 [Usitatibacter sp.]|nr:hypothetical protein [Usitatibacter sp.]
MPSLLARVERLEAANPTHASRPAIAVQFVGSDNGRPLQWNPTRAWGGDEANAITRRASELPEAFEERALDHFAAIDAPSPLVVLFN